MAKKIKGITIELDGETKGLEKALSDVDKRSRNLNTELSQVNKLLKFNPDNVELIAQRQKLLNQQVENTTDRLNKLKSVEKQVEQQFNLGKIGEQEFREFQREIIATEGRLNHFKKTLDSTDDTKGLDNVKKDVKEVKKETNKAERAASKLGDAFKSAAKAASAISVAGAAGVGGLVEGTEEYNTSMARLSVNANRAGIDIEEVNKAFQQMKLVSDETDSSVEAVSNLIAAGFDPSGITEATDAIAGAAIQWSDTLNVEGLSDGIQETLALGEATGMFAEMLERSGIDLDTFNEGLAAATESGKNQQFILDQLTNLELADFFNAYKEGNPELIAQKEATENLNSELAELGLTLSPLVTDFKNFLAEIVNFVDETINFVQGFDSMEEGIMALITKLVEEGAKMVPALISGIASNLPMLLETGWQIITNLIQGLITYLPQLFETWNQIILAQNENIKTYLPQLIELGLQLIQSLALGIINALPFIIEQVITIVSTVITTIIENLPKIIETGTNILNALIDGIISILPQLTDMAIELISTLMTTMLNNLPKIVRAGIELLNALIRGITDMLPALIKMAIKLIVELVAVLIANLPMILSAGIEIILALIDGLIDAIPELLAAIPEIIDAIFEAFGEIDWSEIGVDIIQGLISGITNMAGNIWSAVKGVANNIVSTLRGELDTHSPSRVTEAIGEDTGEGLVVGMRAMGTRIKRASERMAEQTVPEPQDISGLTMNGNRGNGAMVGNIDFNGLFNGANFYVREERDIREVARELHIMMNQAARSQGVI